MDGPGRRVALFLQGCSLRCPWCHSPHSWPTRPTLLFFKDRCVRCGNCAEVCPNGVHRFVGGRHMLDRSLCVGCGQCVHLCPTTTSGRGFAGALALAGRLEDTSAVFEQIRPQLEVFQRIGGLTVSGGEPLLQAHAVGDLLDRCRVAGFHTAVETSGFGSTRAVAGLVGRVDTWLFGLRPVSDASSEGERVADWGTVTRNLETVVRRCGADSIVVRTPIVPGMTDGESSLQTIANTMNRLGLGRIEILPHHRHARHYHDALGRSYPLTRARVPSRKTLTSIREFFESRSIEVKVV